jgi:hypothetical protein
VAEATRVMFKWQVHVIPQFRYFDQDQIDFNHFCIGPLPTLNPLSSSPYNQSFAPRPHLLSLISIPCLPQNLLSHESYIQTLFTSFNLTSLLPPFSSQISHDPLSSPYSMLLMSLDREAGKTSVVTAARQVLPDADAHAASPLLELRLFERVPP